MHADTMTVLHHTERRLCSFDIPSWIDRNLSVQYKYIHLKACLMAIQLNVLHWSNHIVMWALVPLEGSTFILHTKDSSTWSSMLPGIYLSCCLGECFLQNVTMLQEDVIVTTEGEETFIYILSQLSQFTGVLN